MLRPHLALLRVVLLLGLLLPSLLPGVAGAQSTDLNKVDPVLRDLMAAADDSKLFPIIVEMKHLKAIHSKREAEKNGTTVFGVPRPNVARADQAYALITSSGGYPVGKLPIVNGAAGFANKAAVQALSGVADVLAVHEDRTIQPRRGKQSPSLWPPGLLAAAYPRVTRADKVWLQGVNGAGITVAVLDSGVHEDRDLAGRIVARVNFAGKLEPGQTDPGGHGTHVAGIIAGDGARSEGEYVGIAPRAKIADVRVLNSNGNGRLSSVIAGIQWSVDNKALHNIRVINLSLGAPAKRAFVSDPAAAAVEYAWRAGIVVVAAAGNAGPDAGTVETPGYDPYVITVGATDDQATLHVDDDLLGWFSSWGTPELGRPKPDLVAPGRKIYSLMAPGSHLEKSLLAADRVVLAKNGAVYYRLTGTSMATPIVAGAVALMLQRQPGLTPDQVKAILVGTTQRYAQKQSVTWSDAADGSGLVDAYAAVNSPILGAANQGLTPSGGFARAAYVKLFSDTTAPIWRTTDSSNPKTWREVNWDDFAWDDFAWDDFAWDDFAWDAYRWQDFAWDDFAWDDFAWDDFAWDGYVGGQDFAWDDFAWDAVTLLD